MLGEHPVAVSICPPQTPHGLAWDRARAIAVNYNKKCFVRDIAFLSCLLYQLLEYEIDGWTLKRCLPAKTCVISSFRREVHQMRTALF
jgi:hypothetical protein